MISVSLSIFCALFSWIAGKPIDPNIDLELVKMVGVIGAIDGKITIVSIKPLGVGSFGIVLPGETIDKKLVAIKMEPQQKNETGSSGNVPLLYEDEYEAYEALDALNNLNVQKNNIPTVYYIGKFLKYNVIVMTRLEVNIGDYFDEKEEFSNFRTPLIATVGAIRGIKYLHSKGVLHRDIKGSNFLSLLNRAFLIDFNLAVLREKADAIRVGSPIYMSTSAHDRLPQKEIDDWASLGYVFIEFGGGKLAWAGKTKDEMAESKRDWDLVDGLCDTMKYEELKEPCHKLIADLRSKMQEPRNELPAYDYIYEVMSRALCGKPECYDQYLFEWQTTEEQKTKSRKQAKLPSIKSIKIPNKIRGHVFREGSGSLSDKQSKPTTRSSSTTKKTQLSAPSAPPQSQKTFVTSISQPVMHFSPFTSMAPTSPLQWFAPHQMTAQQVLLTPNFPTSMPTSYPNTFYNHYYGHGSPFISPFNQNGPIAVLVNA